MSPSTVVAAPLMRPLLLRLLALVSIPMMLMTLVVAPAAAAARADVANPPRGSDGTVVDLSALFRPLPENVADWLPLDVETWVNRTLGYPELAPIVRAHLIDGPTLVRLDDVEAAFGSRHYIQITKIKAHIEILRGRCSCGVTVPVDFWSYFEQHRGFVLRLGSTLAYLPRVGYAYVFLMDAQTYNALMAPSMSTAEALAAIDGATGSAVSVVPWYATVLYVVLSLAAPHLLLAYKVLLVWSYNYFTMTLVLGFLMVEQLQEYISFMTFYMLMKRGRVSLAAALWTVFRYVMVVPLVVNLLAFVVPGFVAQLLFIAFLLHCTVAIGSTIIGFIYAIVNRGSQTSTDDKDGKAQ